MKTKIFIFWFYRNLRLEENGVKSIDIHFEVPRSNTNIINE